MDHRLLREITDRDSRRGRSRIDHLTHRKHFRELSDDLSAPSASRRCFEVDAGEPRMSAVDAQSQLPAPRYTVAIEGKASIMRTSRNCRECPLTEIRQAAA
jgi:hypothetical protein